MFIYWYKCYRYEGSPNKWVVQNMRVVQQLYGVFILYILYGMFMLDILYGVLILKASLCKCYRYEGSLNKRGRVCADEQV